MKTIEEKPEIMAVKLGFNPNSSSIGILVKIFIYNTLAISVIFAFLGLMLNFKRKKSADGPELSSEEKPKVEDKKSDKEPAKD